MKNPMRSNEFIVLVMVWYVMEIARFGDFVLRIIQNLFKYHSTNQVSLIFLPPHSDTPPGEGFLYDSRLVTIIAA